jgi:hypothetical protein
VILDRPLIGSGEEPEPKLVPVVPGRLVEVVVDRLVVRELGHPALEIGDRRGVTLVFSGQLAQSIEPSM